MFFYVMKRFQIFFYIMVVSFNLTSCGSFWEGMGGVSGGGYGMYGGVPYGLQPNVAAARAGQVIRNQTQQQIDNFWTSGAAYSEPVVTTPVVTSSSSSYGGSTTSSSSSSSGSVCVTCHGGGKCNSCHGSGMRTDNQFGTGTSSSVKCGVCGGSGICSVCRGSGKR